MAKADHEVKIKLHQERSCIASKKLLNELEKIKPRLTAFDDRERKSG